MNKLVSTSSEHCFCLVWAYPGGKRQKSEIVRKECQCHKWASSKSRVPVSQVEQMFSLTFWGPSKKDSKSALCVYCYEHNHANQNSEHALKRWKAPRMKSVIRGAKHFSDRAGHTEMVSSLISFPGSPCPELHLSHFGQGQELSLLCSSFMISVWVCQQRTVSSLRGQFYLT